MLKNNAMEISGVSLRQATKLYLLLFGLHVLQGLSSLGIKLRLWIDSIARVVFSVKTGLGGKRGQQG